MSDIEARLRECEYRLAQALYQIEVLKGQLGQAQQLVVSSIAAGAS